MEKFVDVILPLPLHACFTYALPPETGERVRIGCRVVVPFGKKKFYTGIVRNVHYLKPQEYEVKEVTAVLDERPILLPLQLRFWEWLADYYLCTQGDVYKAALPSGLKLESETVVEINPDFEVTERLTERERKVWDLLAGEDAQTVTKLEKESGLKNILGVIKSLLDKEAIFVKEELRRTYKPKEETRVRLTEAAGNEHRLHFIFDELQRRAPKQLDLLMKYIELSGRLGGGGLKEVSKADLLKRSGATSAVFSALVRRGVFEVYRQEVGRLAGIGQAARPLNELNVHQRKAYDAILTSFQTKNVCLLYGVTASGKTEIYIHLIAEALRQGKQVLYLLPEIALTAQITERLRRAFGAHLGVYHSKFPDAERVEVWQKQLSDRPYDIILGVRSSVFLPFARLGLVIVDEEHENTYKQQDPAPRYHARNAALVLASMCGAKTLLGTATPSVESWFNATEGGKYALVELKERYKEMQLPEIIPVDVKELQRKKRMNGPFSPVLLQYVRQALEQKEQVILFQNRRGFAPMIECHTCGWVPKCKNCDVSLTYHKGLNMLTCHYCGYTIPVPRKCPACEGVDLRDRGFGTEKIEDDIKTVFPEARVARMDLDTTRTRTAYERIIADFEQGKTDIMIGTQMVSKGLDFDHVSVVGILNADTMLNYPDFRAYERAFQLMAQVAGRAGRKNKRGRVVLQTKSIDHPIIAQVMRNDFEGMVAGQLAERQLYHYPPYYRLVYVYLKHRKEDVLGRAAGQMAAYLRSGLGDNRVLGPDKPPVARIQMLFIRKIVIKIEQKIAMNKIREYLVQVQRTLMVDECFRSLIVYYDVDPV